jgi:hypothetical protein
MHRDRCFDPFEWFSSSLSFTLETRHTRHHYELMAQDHLFGRAEWSYGFLSMIVISMRVIVVFASGRLRVPEVDNG